MKVFSALLFTLAMMKEMAAMTDMVQLACKDDSKKGMKQIWKLDFEHQLPLLI